MVGFNTLFVLLRAEAGVRVGDLDGELLGALDNSLALLGGNTMSNLGTIFAVLHHQDFQFLQD